MKICDAYELRGGQECRPRSLFSEQFQDGSGLDQDAAVVANVHQLAPRYVGQHPLELIEARNPEWNDLYGSIC